LLNFGTGAIATYDSQASDTITELNTSTAGGMITASGNADVIEFSSGDRRRSSSTAKFNVFVARAEVNFGIKCGRAWLSPPRNDVRGRRGFRCRRRDRCLAAAAEDNDLGRFLIDLHDIVVAVEQARNHLPERTRISHAGGRTERDSSAVAQFERRAER
jgi:hypothetical protein